MNGFATSVADSYSFSKVMLRLVDVLVMVSATLGNSLLTMQSFLNIHFWAFTNLFSRGVYFRMYYVSMACSCDESILDCEKLTYLEACFTSSVSTIMLVLGFGVSMICCLVVS